MSQSLSLNPAHTLKNTIEEETGRNAEQRTLQQMCDVARSLWPKISVRFMISKIMASLNAKRSNT